MTKWTPEQIAVVEQAMQAKRDGKRMNYPALAAQLGTTVKAVEQKVYHIRKLAGLVENRDDPNVRWTDETRQQIRQLRETGLTYRQIAGRFPGASQKAIEKQYLRLVRGNQAAAHQWTNPRQWMECEDQTLRRSLDSGLAWHAVARAVGRSVNACKNRGQLIGLTQRRTAAPSAPGRIEQIKQARWDRAASLLPASLTAWICGDPPPGRSALDRKRQEGPLQ